MTSKAFLWYAKGVNGEAPITKNGFTQIEYGTAKGMTPIEKNVIVVDEQGNTYEATYPKRAKGLVKNGRARFVDETTICLACPPNEKTEDNIMSENKKQQEVINNQPERPAPKEESKDTLAYCLEQIEKILDSQKDGFYTEAMTQLKELTSTGPGDIAGAEKAKAIGAAIKCRETTNQQLLSFYQSMVDDLKPKPNAQQTILEGIERILCNPEVRDNLKMEMVAELMTAL